MQLHFLQYVIESEKKKKNLNLGTLTNSQNLPPSLEVNYILATNAVPIILLFKL